MKTEPKFHPRPADHGESQSFLSRSWRSWKNKTPAWLGLVLGASWVLAVGVLAFSSNRLLQGLDESFHVLSSAHPWASPAVGIFFGFYLHPLWVLGQEQVLGFRLVGFAALSLATLVFGFFFVRLLRQLDLRTPIRPWIPAVTFSLLIMAFTRYVVGMRTPNYDWVVLVGGMLFAAGWFAIEAGAKPGFPCLAGGLCAFGLLSVGMGKWTALPGYLVLLGLLLLGKSREGRIWRWVGGGAVWLMALAGLFVWYVTPEGIEAVIRAGKVQLAIHAHDRAWTRLPVDLLKFCWTMLRAAPYIAALYGAIGWVLYRRQKQKPETAVVSGLTFLLGLPLIGLRGHFTGGGEYFAKGVMVTAVWFLGVIFMCAPYRGGDSRGVMVRTLGLLLVLPWLDGVGTATSMVDYLGYGLVFPVAAAWILLLRAAGCGLPLWCVGASLLTLGVAHAARVATSTWHVHRLGSAWAEVRRIQTGPEAGKFFSYPAAVECLTRISGEMERQGFRPGDPILGLTDLPGLVYFLGGVSPGASWYQSYRMDETYDGTRRHLADIPPEVLRKCWVIFRKNNKSSEALELIWPKAPGVPLPARIGDEYPWPFEPANRRLEPVFLYRPAGG